MDRGCWKKAGKSRGDEIKRRAGHLAANCGSRVGFQRGRRRRDASITLNLPRAFPAVCPLSLFLSSLLSAGEIRRGGGGGGGVRLNELELK